MSKKSKYENEDVGPLGKLGSALISNDYSIVPIKVGKKAPMFDGWEKSKSTMRQIDEWIENGHRHSGIGIMCRDTPGVDLDIRDEELADMAEKKARELLGDAPIRIGLAPKRLLMYRTDEPFKKMISAKYMDDSDWPEKHQIEILGDGQQFVAFHIHPDTGKPYTWPNGDGPDVTNAADLPVITREKCQQLLDWFEDAVATLRPGWKKVTKQRDHQEGNVDFDDPFISDTAVIDISEDELLDRLMLIDSSLPYDQWFQVGMALFHQYNGDDRGLEIWHEWSETSEKYEKGVLDDKWKTFDISDKKRAPITARFILRLAKEAVDDKAARKMMKLRDAFNDAKTKQDWEKARRMANEAEIDGLTRAALAPLAKDRLDFITGTKTPLAEVKKAIAYQPSRDEDVPKWVEPWVYDTSDDKFYSTEYKIAVTQQGFNAMFDRKAITKKDILEGKGSSNTASHLALNLYRIQTVNGRRYEPGKDPVFYAPDGVFANTYPEHEIPELPEKLTPRDIRAINRVKDHVRHLLEDPRERRLFVDWMSWVVQNPGRHANWAILLQGVQGDGKSFFGFLMRAVMGVSNVRMLNAHILESDFTDWVVGQCVTCIEEVRLIKHNKYEVVNRIKPFITNNVVEVHPKGKAPYSAINTTSYMAFSNFQDCLPLDENERRYCVLFSRWQRKDKLTEFKEENPDYYEKLYQTLETSAPALRKWLLERELDNDFNPLGDAPETQARRQMIRLAQPEFIQQLHDAISEEVDPLISYELLDLSVLNDKFFDMGVEVPAAKALSSMLARANFESLGKVWMGDRGVMFYSREPEKFRTLGADNTWRTDPAKVRDYVKRMSSTKNTALDEDDDEL